MKNRTIILSSKLVWIITILTLLTYILINFVNESKTYAAQTRETYSASKMANYPGYKELIESLKAKHPNWNITIFYTGLDWNQVIKNETTAYHGRNLVSSSRPSSWICSICGDKHYDNGSWRCASEAAVSYFMDSRNWINDANIFQFENLSYNSSIQTLEGVQKIIANIGYMQGSTITYTKTDGTQGTLNKSYAQVIMEAAQAAGISPYHLASRIKQEQGAGSTPGSTATGTYSGYVGYYNFLNIKASGSGSAAVIANGLQHAKDNGWTNPEISIIEGAKVIAKNYINDGQDTLYLQKFDVDSSDGTLYYFQYMQNVSAAQSEGTSVRSAYESLGLLNSSIDFVIPVYENMPETICGEPVQAGIVTQNVKVKGTNVNVRSGASTSSGIIATVNTPDTLLRIETAINKSSDGFYWDKIVLPDGRKGFIVRTYLVETEDVTNCNDTVITNTSVNLRNGPGTEGTTVITTLTKGQVMTRIETGKYNLNGYAWDRVKLADGRQGYIAQCYIDVSGTSSATGEIIRVICNSGLKVRELPGTNQKVLTYLDKGNTLTRTQANASTANGYIWDKVVTASGIEGYIARGTSTETYIEVVSTVDDGANTGNATNNNFKLDGTELICEPGTNLEVIKEKYTDTQISIKNASGAEVTDGTVGTGYVITIGANTYNVVKLGDANGDGKITAGDYVIIKNQIMGTGNIDDKTKAGADANQDGNITAGDYVVIKNQIMGTSTINIKGDL